VLKYRVDPSTNFITVLMNYSGAGLFTAPIPGQGAGTAVAFYISTQRTARLPLLSTSAEQRNVTTAFSR